MGDTLTVMMRRGANRPSTLAYPTRFGMNRKRPCEEPLPSKRRLSVPIAHVFFRRPLPVRYPLPQAHAFVRSLYESLYWRQFESDDASPLG